MSKCFLCLSAVFDSKTADHLLGRCCLVLKAGFLSCKINLPSACGKVPLESVSFKTLQSLGLQIQRCVPMLLDLILVLPILAGRGLQHSL